MYSKVRYEWKKFYFVFVLYLSFIFSEHHRKLFIVEYREEDSCLTIPSDIQHPSAHLSLMGGVVIHIIDDFFMSCKPPSFPGYN